MISASEKTEFVLIKKLGESLTAEVFLAKNKRTDESILVKKIRPAFVLDGVKEHIEQQHLYLRRLNIEQITIPELQFDGDQAIQFVQPYLKGQLLRHWLAEHRQMDVTTLLEFGIALADCVAARHQAVLIHKAIKPNNVVIQENPLRVSLVDEIRVVDDMQLSQFIQDDQYRRETLPYIAPELTGRIRIHIDYYSDLYSLGAVLFECATGQPPFLSEDSLAIIHSHLAEVPRRVSDVSPGYPLIVSEIIATLLKKEPEQRYQSAKGLRADLQTCLSFWQAAQARGDTPEIPAFELKQHEYSNQITIPSILIGREHQQQQLLGAYERVCSGNFGIVMISGLSGIGKTRLIQELELPIVAKRGYYTSGKFNQFAKHLPYSTLVQAFSRLIRQLLTEDSARLSYWRQHIQDVVGINGQLLVDIAPELEHIIGKQPIVMMLPPIEAQSRFKDLFSRFLACLASPTHPLVLFIDDLQWCDLATFDLLEVIYSQPHMYPYLLIIGAYRDNEVDENHRVSQMEKSILASSQYILKLHLGPLDRVSVNKMVSFILNTYLTRTQEITDIIYSVSLGNPLYVNESLRWLHQNNRIALADNGLWTWDYQALLSVQLPGSARAMFYDKLQHFPHDVVELLSTGAMLGAQFEAADLALITKTPLPTLYILLNEVFSQHILQHSKTSLAFFHDQMQAAAADFLNERQKRQCHERIARAFINQWQQEEKRTDAARASTARLFTIVEHLAAGRADNAISADLFVEAQFNYRAGVAAMDSFALEASNHYLSQSAELCPLGRWLTDYDFMFSLYKRLARAALINGDQARANEIANIALAHAQTDLDRAEFLYEQTVAFGSLGQVKNCIELGGKALALLNENLPLSSREAQLEIDRLVKQLHHGNDEVWERIANARLLEDRRIILTLHLYGEMQSSFYLSGQVDLVFLMALRSIKIAVQNGIDDFTLFSLAVMAFYFQTQDNYSLSIAYVNALFRMTNRFPNTFGFVRAMTAGNWLAFHSSNSASSMLLLCQQTMDSGKKCGELQFTGLSNCPLVWYTFVLGDSLQHLKVETEKLISFSRQFGLTVPLGVGEAMQLSLSCLWSSNSEKVSESTHFDKIARWKEQEHVVSLSCYFTFSGIAAYYEHRYADAQRFLVKGAAYLNGTSNTIVYRLWHVFRYLAALQTGERHGDEGDIHALFERVTRWALHGPILRPYLALMQAETTALDSGLRDARIAYQDAIDVAHQEHYVFLEAFLNERMWLCLKKENHFSGEIYQNAAIFLYRRCGAVKKVAHISAALGGRFSAGLHADVAQDESVLSQDRTGSVGEYHALDKSLDFDFLFAAVKAIVSELDFSKLLKLIVESIMARLGAKTGYVLVAENDLLVPYVSADKGQQVQVKLMDDLGFSLSKLSMGLAYYVFHSQAKVILQDAFKEGEFVADEIVQREKLRSILCIPITIQKQVLGVIFLENSLIKSVFTESQIALADLLTAQAAIAVQNAILLRNMKSAHSTIERLNKDLEQKVDDRTRELESVHRELVRKEKLSTLGQLTATVAHEIRNPLGTVRTAVFSIGDAIERNQPERVRRALLLAERNIRRCDVIIEDLLSFTRKKVLKLTPVVLDTWLGHLLSELKVPDGVERSSTLVSGATVDIDAEYLRRAVINVMDNAVQALSVEKPLLNKIHIETRVCDGRVEIRVSDTGPGIPTDILDRVFEPLFSTKTYGVGLGLPIVKDIMEEHHGGISIESSVGKGTTVTLWLLVIE